MPKIALIHTTLNSVEPSNKAFAQLGRADLQLFNYLNEGVMPELSKNGAVPNVRRAILQAIWSAEDEGADGIMMNCSLMSPYAAELQKYCNVPLISADIAMLEYVVLKASRIAVIATVENAGPTTGKLLEAMATEKGKQVSVDIFIIKEAFEALNNKDKDRHNLLIQKKASELDGKYDMIVFAQISMAQAATPDFKTETEIVTSPVISAKALLARIAEG